MSQSISKLESLEGRRLFSAPWGWQAKQIGQDRLAAELPQIDGRGTSIAIVDSGVDYNHPSLGNGWGNKVVAGYDFISNDTNPMSDTYAHGTGSAGMAAASAYDYKGVHYSGIAPGAKVIALRENNTTGVAKSLQWIVDNKAKYNIVAANVLDYGGGSGPDAGRVKSLMAQLTSMGVYLTVPSGNNSNAKAIAAHADTFAVVGATNSGDGIAGFSNRGAGLDFLAPGQKVGVTYYDVGSKKAIYVDTGDGTSWSAPQIAGAAALIRQVNPKFSNGQITSILRDSGTLKYDSGSGRSYPRLNLYAAVKLAYQRSGQAQPDPVDTTPDPDPVTTPTAPGGVTISTPTNVGTNTTIQVEDFDSGADGTTYHDTDGANLGGNTYRNGTGVDVITLNDSGSTRGVGFTKAGEWLRYTVNVQSAGTYTANFRLSALGSGGAFHLEVDGKNVTGTLTAPDTKSWTSFTTVGKAGIALTGGKHTLKLVMEKAGKSGFVANFNQMQFVKATTTTTTTPPPTTNTPGAPAGEVIGTPVAIGTGGTIQVEDFWSGAEGSTYHDTDAANLGGNGYRNGTGVDVITLNDGGSTRGVGFTKAGEWLTYKADVQAAGVYTLAFRLSALGAGGKFHLEVDGKNVTGSLAVPDTKNWNTFTTVVKTGVSLAAGTRTLKLVFDKAGKSGYVGNFNSIGFTRTSASTTTAAAAPVATGRTPFATTNIAAGSTATLQAENFDNGGEGVAFHDTTSANEGGQYRGAGVDLEKTTDTGGGYDVGYVKAGEWLDYTVNVTKAGTFNVDTRVASAYAGGKFHLEVDGTNVTGSLAFANTGGFQKWATVRKSGVSLTAGTHTVKLVIETTGGKLFAGNVNWIKFS